MASQDPKHRSFSSTKESLKAFGYEKREHKYLHSSNILMASLSLFLFLLLESKEVMIKDSLEFSLIPSITFLIRIWKWFAHAFSNICFFKSSLPYSAEILFPIHILNRSYLPFQDETSSCRCRINDETDLL